MKQDDKARKIEKIKVAFFCKHKRLASECSRCKGKDWRDSLSESGKKLGQIVEELISTKEIERIEVEEYLNKERKKKRIRKLATFAGVIIAGFLTYEGGKRTLKLLFRKKEEPQK